MLLLEDAVTGHGHPARRMRIEIGVEHADEAGQAYTPAPGHSALFPDPEHCLSKDYILV